MPTMRLRRSLIPILVIVLAYVGFPPLVRMIFSPELPVATLHRYSSPRPLPDFKFADASGRNVTLARFRGSFVLVNVWATWCPPCQAEMASLDHLARQLADTHVKIVPISIDVSGVPSVHYFYERQGIKNLPIYVDPSKNAMDAFGLIGIPTTLLIGTDGREIARMPGPAKWDAPESVKRIMAVTIITKPTIQSFHMPTIAAPGTTIVCSKSQGAPKTQTPASTLTQSCQ